MSNDQNTYELKDTSHFDGGSENPEEHQYLALLEDVMESGIYKEDRTGVGCYSVFGREMRFDLTGGKIPLLTTKKMGIKSIIAELLWFLEGSTNSKRLNELGAKIWDEWATEDGDVGPIYGKMWTAWEVPSPVATLEKIEDIIDMFDHLDHVSPLDIREKLKNLAQFVMNPPKVNQIKELITTLKENPNSRRMLVTAWNPAVLPQDYRWEYNYLDPSAAAEATHVGWEPMTPDQRLDWLWEHHGIGNGHGIFDAEILEQHATPTHRRKVKVTPQDNVEKGRAALPACHAMLQVHTRELTLEERGKWWVDHDGCVVTVGSALSILHTLSTQSVDGSSEQDRVFINKLHKELDLKNVPRYALTLQFYCRSQDVPIGTPYNLASYAILAHMLAQCVGMVAEELIWMGGDVHVYRGQIEGVKTQLEREPREFPTLKINPEKKDIFSFTQDDFELVGYGPHPKISFGDIAV